MKKNQDQIKTKRVQPSLENSIKGVLDAIDDIYWNRVQAFKDRDLDKAMEFWANLVWIVDIFKIEKLKMLVKDLPKEKQESFEEIFKHIESEDFKLN